MKRLLLIALALGSLILPACSSDGQINLFGYKSGNLFDCKYKTIRVDIFENRTYYRGLEFELAQDLVNQIESITPMKVVQTNPDLILTGKILTYAKSVSLESPVNEIRDGNLTMTVEVVLKDGHTGEILSKPAPRLQAQPGADQLPVLIDRPEIPGLVNLPAPVTPTTPGTSANQATMLAPVPQTPAMVPGPPVDPNQPAGSPSDPAVINAPTRPQIVNGQVVPPTPAQKGVVIRATTNYTPELGQSNLIGNQKLNYNVATQIVNLMEKPW